MKPDIDNVIYCIDRCVCHVPDACKDCKYDSLYPYNECCETLLKDARILLQDQKNQLQLQYEQGFHDGYQQALSEMLTCSVCSYYTKFTSTGGFCSKHQYLVTGNDYCSMNRRREDKTNG